MGWLKLTTLFVYKNLLPTLRSTVFVQVNGELPNSSLTFNNRHHSLIEVTDGGTAMSCHPGYLCPSVSLPAPVKELKE